MKSRVRISPWSTDDEREFLAAVGASRRLHRPWVSPPQTSEAFLSKVASGQGPTHYAFVARHRAAGGLVGCIEITNVVRGKFLSGYLGYYAFAGFERQGLMSEALQQVLRVAFGKLGLHRLEANIQPQNVASLALARRCGFRREGFSPRYLKIGGRWRDHERWAYVSD